MTERIRKQIVPLLLCVASLLLNGCERRPLEERIGTLAIVPIRIDWSESKLDVSDITNFSVWLFPKDGSRPIETHFKGSLTDIELKAPLGEYAMIVFNETADDIKWDGFIEFRGTDSYDTFGSYLCEDESNLANAMRGPSTYYKTAKALAAWSIDEFVVTQSMINVTRTRAQQQSRAGESAETRAEIEEANKMLERVAVVTPQPMVHSVHVKSKVMNLNSAKGATASFRGAAYGVLLATGKVVKTSVDHLLPMNNRQYDETGKNGTIECRFMTFGLLPEEEVTINMNFLMQDDTWLEDDHRFDVTEVVTGSNQYEIVINIGQPAEEQPEDEDHDIILPESAINSNVGVGDWDDELIDIK